MKTTQIKRIALILLSMLLSSCARDFYINKEYKLCYNTYYNGEKLTSSSPRPSGTIDIKLFNVFYNEIPYTHQNFFEDMDGYKYSSLTRSGTSSAPYTPIVFHSSDDIRSDCRTVTLDCNNGRDCIYDLKNQDNISPWMEAIVFGVSESEAFLQYYGEPTTREESEKMYVGSYADVALVGVEKEHIHIKEFDKTGRNITLIKPTVYVNYHFYSQSYEEENTDEHRFEEIRELRRIEAERISEKIGLNNTHLFVSVEDVLSGEYDSMMDEMFTMEEQENYLSLLLGRLAPSNSEI